MRILFLTYDFPYPTTSGGKVRAFNLLKYAHTKGISVHLLSFIREEVSEEARAAVKKIGVDRVSTFPRRSVRDFKNVKTFFSSESLFKTLYYDEEIAAFIAKTIVDEKIDVLHCESFYTAYYLEAYRKSNIVRTIYGSENIEYRLYEDYTRDRAPLPLRPLFAEQARRIKREEEGIVKAADVTLAVTKKEQQYFKTLTDNVAVIENGVSLTEFAYRKRNDTEKKIILFVGNFQYFPNKDAVMFFYESVLKKLDLSDIEFSIIGKGSTQFQELNDPRIKTTEFIDDIRDAYYAAEMFVSPIRIGGGTNFKILEAMATGLPVVSFTDRVREIGARGEVDVLLADDGASFLKQTQRLLDDSELGEKLARNAREIIEKQFSWDIIGKHLREIWYEKN